MKVSSAAQTAASVQNQKVNSAVDQAVETAPKERQEELREKTIPPSYDRPAFSYSERKKAEEEDNGLYTLFHYFKDKDKKGKKDIRNTSLKKDYDTAGIYSMVARAATKSGVKAAMSEAHRRIQSIGSAAVFGSSAEQIRAKRAIASLQKLLARGGRKIRQLDQETLLKIRQQRAKEREEVKREQQAALERQQERKRRSRMDNALDAEGKAAQRYQEYEYARQQYEVTYTASNPAVPPSGSAPVNPAVPADTAASAAMSGTDAAAADIV